MKKEYTKPQLVKHGKLEEQTQAGLNLLGSPDGPIAGGACS
ncbi:MAG: hypothetical protein ACJAT9_000238 [Polaribacter sp.]|jgi:hypothetical protein|tara:strand:+ start:332 stop:454 length:123 start_codon:yes stop_codon:yes gene_type:complete